ncbi:hypothetical protein [Neobacillus sp. YIM B06451]|uniref:hypothetical protein n=1 Tax=Neobacillus sp. YIM B06451 TaxID=3070994 RepID=UPI00292F2B06|nr:hypothetical protein [Neobacillus sp. YIM B06451]
MRKVSGFLLSMLLVIGFFPAEKIQAEEGSSCSQYKGVSKIMWEGMELKPNQIGLLLVKKETPLFKPNGTVSRTLKAGETYRIYTFKSNTLGVGGGYYITRDARVDYKTPSKAKLMAVKCIQNAVLHTVSMDRVTKLIVEKESQRSEKELLSRLEKALQKVTAADYTNSVEAHTEVTVALFAIDRQIDYSGWKNVSGLYNTLEGYKNAFDGRIRIPSNVYNYDPIQIYGNMEFASGVFNRVYGKVKGLKNSSSIKAQNPITEEVIAQFGRHGYNSMNQKEYDQVMKIVTQSLKGYKEAKDVYKAEYHQYYLDYINGARWDGNNDNQSDRNMILRMAEGSLGELVRAGLSKTEIEKIFRTSIVANNLISTIPYQSSGGYSYSYDGSTVSVKKNDPKYEISVSAYDALIRGILGKCAKQMVKSAVFDAMGFNTMIVKSKYTESDLMIFQAGGKWWYMDNWDYMYEEFSEHMKTIYHSKIPPTNGKGAPVK